MPFDLDFPTTINVAAPSPASITAEVVHAAGIAPDIATVMVTVTGNEQPLENCLTIIDFGDAGETSPVPAVTNWADITDTSRTYGDVGGHLYGSAGTYTITVTFLEWGRAPVTTTVQHTVVDRDTYAFDRVFIVDPAGVYAGAPSFPNAVSVTQTTNIDDAWSDTLNADDEYIVMVARGNSYGSIGTLFGNAVQGLRFRRNLRVAAYGTGNDPEMLGRFVNTGNNPLTFLGLYDLDVHEGWDVSTESGTVSANSGAQLRFSNDGGSVQQGLVHFVRGQNHSNNVAAYPIGVPVLFAHSKVYDNRDYGALSSGDIAFIHCDMRRSPTALGGGAQSLNPSDVLSANGGSGKTGNAHTPLRHASHAARPASHPAFVLLQKNWIFNLWGWPNGGSSPDHQACARLGTGPFENTDRFRVFGNILEGGTSPLEFKSADASPLPTYMNAIVAHNLMVYTPNHSNFLLSEIDRGGVKFVNNVIIGFDVAKEPGTNPTSAWFGLFATVTNPTSEQVSVPIVVRKNTFVLLTATSGDFSVTPVGPDTGGSLSLASKVSPGLVVDDADNIVHIPNVTGQPNIGDILTTALGVNASYAGYQHATQPLDTAYRTDDQALFLAQPTATSTSGWQDGTTQVIGDFFGNVRPTNGTASQGAIDPAGVAA